MGVGGLGAGGTVVERAGAAVTGRTGVKAGVAVGP